MDFDLDESQSDLRDLAAGLLDRLAGEDRAPAEAWTAMARAGLLSACLPEDVGGAGLGAVGLAVLLREVGAQVAAVPAFATLALGAFSLAGSGTPAQRALLPAVGEGDVVLTAAVREPGNLGQPRTLARRSGTGYVLDGVKIAVPYARQAAVVLVPATVPGEGTGVFLVPSDAAGVSHHRHPTATGEPASRLGLDAVRVGADALLGGRADGVAAADLDRHAVAGAVATVSGVLAGALKLTTAHVKTREQFGRPLAEFQAVTMQVADVYIAGRALDAVMWAACWRLGAGVTRGGDGAGALPAGADAVHAGADAVHAGAGAVPAGKDGAWDDADELLGVAAWHAAGPALRALYICQHLHGGLGVDVTYPLHRYFSWGTYYAHLLGGEQARLDMLGDLLARTAAGNAAGTAAAAGPGVAAGIPALAGTGVAAGTQAETVAGAGVTRAGATRVGVTGAAARGDDIRTDAADADGRPQQTSG